MASPDGQDGSVRIRQDARVYAALLDGEERAEHSIARDRRGYVHVARGKATVNGHPLEGGDALKASGEQRIVIEQGDGAEVLLFDLP